MWEYVPLYVVTVQQSQAKIATIAPLMYQVVEHVEMESKIPMKIANHVLRIIDHVAEQDSYLVETVS